MDERVLYTALGWALWGLGVGILFLSPSWDLGSRLNLGIVCIIAAGITVLGATIGFFGILSLTHILQSKPKQGCSETENKEDCN